MTRQPKSNRGGARPGAGKKPGPLGAKLPVTVKFSPVIHDFFATLEETRGTFLERICLNSKEFRQWQKKLPKNSEN